MVIYEIHVGVFEVERWLPDIPWGYICDPISLVYIIVSFRHGRGTWVRRGTRDVGRTFGE